MSSNHFFERIKAQYTKQLPFVAYRKPNQELVKAKLQTTNDIIYSKDFTEKGFVFSPFENIGETVLIPDEISEVLSVDFENTQAEIQSEVNDFSSPSSEVKSNHIAIVNNGIEAIQSGDFEKVVLSRAESIQLKGDNPIVIFKKLLQRYPSAFVYCWYHPKVGMWLGATPETLLKIEGQRFSIMALAGTQEYHGSIEVKWQDKELQEQQYVTDFILDNLKPYVQKINISDVKTVKAGNLLHLKTMISAKLKSNIVLKELIDVLHPTPAVCGLPKAASKQFILDNEDYNREFYTGFLGELNEQVQSAPRSGKRNIENRAYTITKNSTQLYVNLRCMKLERNKATIYVGGGITLDSNAESEWEETVSKSLVIKSVL